MALPPLERKSARHQRKIKTPEDVRKGVTGLIAEFKSTKQENDLKLMAESVAQMPNEKNKYKVLKVLISTNKFTQVVRAME
ncbi:hypothetical protein KIN20_037437 [Parelaphostrongylus tenuis]|uniref:Uncharacterized protein n=1 Tax=Parelaphostrongylus tenuis TaxID=148309 RepID=A0AAD5MS62_PARTN|nr:hypothetical protein KIN20_011507 [Parelaphostrongylus tenuis]KAJ1373292.1 hypothetical protein KIN20_035653 [Parelaphostrongylus tenuis]KAJ1374690.1 hypothetical protein KIN20_037437 [Parelaphostrongylus tenuis]